MGLFSNKSEGGLMDVIRCDQEQYLVWKWRPSGTANSIKKENAIRFGSSLRVKEGEVAVFVYNRSDGNQMDFIVGPHDQTIKTANFPILTGIVASAFDGSSPFQAEIYFINLQGNNQIKFGIPYFDVFDPRSIDFSAPIAARGTITFNITDYKVFIKLNRMIELELDRFSDQIRDAVTKYVKAFIANAPKDFQIPALQLGRKVLDLSDLIQARLKPEIENDFGVNLKRFDLSNLEFDTESDNYHRLLKRFGDQELITTEGTTEISLENLSETMRIQRKELELQVEGKNLTTHQIDIQADVLKTAAENLGKMSEMNLGGGGGMNPTGMMVGMGIGGAMGNQMGGMMTSINKTPPPPPVLSYHIALNGQQSGPYNIEQLKQFVQTGQFTKEYHVWKEGMSGWELANDVAEISVVFSVVPPPPPAP
jgi:membrane protease subunit (stomatin/prohibitin family)